MVVQSVVLKRMFDTHKAEYEEAVLRSLNSGWYILGKEMEEFEKQFALYLGVKHCIALNSGTDALILAFRALGIHEGDEVIVPANAYIASVIGVTENGGTPVFVDADAHMEIDADAIEEKITDKTKAILPVHLLDNLVEWIKSLNWSENIILNLLKTVHSAMVLSLMVNMQGHSAILAASAFILQNRWELWAMQGQL